MLKPNSQCDHISKWGFGRWLGHECGVLMNGIQCLYKGAPRELPHPLLHHVRTQGENGHLWTSNQARYLPAKPLSLQNWDIKRCCLQATLSTVSVTAAWTDSDTSLTAWLLNLPRYQEECLLCLTHSDPPVQCPLLSLPLNSTDALRPSSRPTCPADCPVPVISPLTQFQHFLFILCEVTQSCPTLCDPTDCSLPGSSVRGIFCSYYSR